MARNELLFRGPIIAGDAEPAQGELWAVGQIVVAFVVGPAGSLVALEPVARNARVTMVEHRLHIEGDDGVTFDAAAMRQALGAWAGQTVTLPDGSTLPAATVQWSNQDVTVTAGTTLHTFAGAKTIVLGNQRFIEHWSGDEAQRLAIVPPAGGGGCGCGKSA